MSITLEDSSQKRKLPHVNEIGEQLHSQGFTGYRSDGRGRGQAFLERKDNVFRQQSVDCYPIAYKLAEQFGYDTSSMGDVFDLADDVRGIPYEKTTEIINGQPVEVKRYLDPFYRGKSDYGERGPRSPACIVIYDGGYMLHVAFELYGKEYNFAPHSGAKPIGRVRLPKLN